MVLERFAVQGVEELGADEEDVELVLDALRVLRPAMRELDVFVAMLHMGRQRWAEAAHVLYALEQNAPQFAYTHAMLAICLNKSGDQHWHRHAELALQSSDNAQIQYLVKGLQAMEDLTLMRAKMRGGVVAVLPDSCRAFLEINAPTSDHVGSITESVTGQDVVPFYGRRA